MSKRRRDEKIQADGIEIKESRHTVQNSRPEYQWQSFEQCWHSCVKNGTPLLMESCKAHLRAMGWLAKPEKWIEGMKHFGIPLEK